MIPEIDIMKWYGDGFDIYQISKLVNLFLRAKHSNMLVNELLVNTYDILGTYVAVGRIFDISASIISKRIKNRIGTTEMIRPEIISIRTLEHILGVYKVWDTAVETICEIFKARPDRYSIPDNLEILLVAHGIKSPKAELIVKDIFE